MGVGYYCQHPQESPGDPSNPGNPRCYGEHRFLHSLYRICKESVDLCVSDSLVGVARELLGLPGLLGLLGCGALMWVLANIVNTPQCTPLGFRDGALMWVLTLLLLLLLCCDVRTSGRC